ncbi:1,3-beta-D-glucan synthase [Physocladia obscura]|uniref:1,3-beta-glucan synthase n=1 Tax=Physocladia obscura TaxID=109957 RepID=A0AAD5T931_9FUNG|nr:1,3-beta-D-glucan synthase [Physocladia obscura]
MKPYAIGQSKTRFNLVVTSNDEDSESESDSDQGEEPDARFAASSSFSIPENVTNAGSFGSFAAATRTSGTSSSQAANLYSPSSSPMPSFPINQSASTARLLAYNSQPPQSASVGSNLNSFGRPQSQSLNQDRGNSSARWSSTQAIATNEIAIASHAQPRSIALQSQAALMDKVRAKTASISSSVDSVNQDTNDFNPLLALDDIGSYFSAIFGFQEDVVKNTKDMLATLIRSRAASYFDASNNISSVAALHHNQVATSAIKQTSFSESRLSNYSTFISMPILSKKFGVEQTDSLAAGLVSLYNDYIYGKNSNYRRWCLSDLVRDPEVSYSVALRAWRRKFRSYSLFEKTKQMLLYFTITQESSNTRLMPELMWFIFKTAIEHLESNNVIPVPQKDYLYRIVKPIYDFHASQLYSKNEKGRFVRRENDHAQIIGYDDLNELFWDAETMDQIALKNGVKFLDLPTAKRWENLGEIDWKKSAKKTYYERRTFINHFIVNYSRLAAFLIGTFLFFLLTLLAPVVWNHRFGPASPYDSPHILTQLPDMPGALRATAFSIGGTVSIFITLVATLSEQFYVPITKRNLSIIYSRAAIVGTLFVLCAAPIAAIGYLYFAQSEDPNGSAIVGLSVAAVAINVIGFTVASFVPLQDFVRRKIYNQEFVGRLSKMTKVQSGTSKAFWLLLIIAKFIETYFVVFHPAIPALESIYAMDTRTCMNQDVFNMCLVLKWFTFAMLSCLLLVFYFLDTYVWWLLMEGVLQYGMSTFKIFKLWQWEKSFPHLPSKLVNRLVATSEMPPVGNYRTLNAQIWNTIMDNFKEDHLISEVQHEKLSFTEVIEESELSGSTFRREAPSLLKDGSQLSVFNVAMENNLGEFANRIFMDPEYLTMLSNGASKIKFFGADSEAERRLKYLEHTLDMNFPTPAPVKKMPTFGLLIPHYAEKIIFSFEELTTLSNGASITLLAYLRSLHKDEWDNLMEECRDLVPDDETPLKQALRDDQSFISTISVNNVDPNVAESIPQAIRLQVRLWASRRQQSLYRTVSGVFKYYEALELKYRIEYADELGNLEEDERARVVKRAVQEKFKLTISMQRYAEFTPEEKDNTKLLFDLFPSIIIVYPERVPQPDGTEKVFTRVIDGFCELDYNNEFIPKLNIELPGWPILGDGKGCNQSHGIYFTRGEFLQVLDANQDHYFEECMKVGSILKEFKVDAGDDPVGLVGLRENIFSAGIGAVADFSATTETTLVSLYQPTLHKLGMRLHYGHPDFWNLSYALPRGGVSKAQKGLHVNEDIYAGMMVMMRGGKNLHCEYTQVGKGKDLGLNSVMGYFSKLAMGMSEQVLSREQYRLGTALPFDRLLTFYFANPGFITSNVFAMLSLQMFTLFFVCISSLSNSLTACPIYDVLGDGTFNATQVELNPAPFGCAIFAPIYDWEKAIFDRYSVPVVFVILIPVMMHTAFERGIMSVLRYLRQLLSLSLLFSVFSTQVWARSFLNTATFGQARYISTGRSVEIARKTFSSLYSNYKEMSMAIGLALTCAVLYTSASTGSNVPPLFLSPFLYNPHQFRFEDFIQDYYAALQWFGTGSYRSSDPKEDSWLAFHKRHRTQYTGTRIDPNEKGIMKETRRRAWRSIIWLHEIAFPIIIALAALTIYGAGTAGGIRFSLYLAALSMLPIISNAIMLLLVFSITLVLGPFAAFAAKKDGIAPITIALLRIWSGVNLLVVLIGCWVLSDFTFKKSILGFLCFCMVQRLYVRFITLCLPREVETNSSNLAWWDGRWNRVKGFRVFVGPIREYFCKIIEMTAFAMDVFQAHIILLVMFPLTWIRYVDDFHSIMVLWIPVSKTEKSISDETRIKRRNRKAAALSAISTFIIVLVILLIPAWWVPTVLRTIQTHVKHNMWRWALGETSCNAKLSCPENQQCVYATFPQVWGDDYGVCYPIPSAIIYQTCGGNIADPALCDRALECFYPTNGTFDETGYCYPRTNDGVLGDVCITSNSTDYFNNVGTFDQCQDDLYCKATPNFPFVGYGYLGTCEKNETPFYVK